MRLRIIGAAALLAAALLGQAPALTTVSDSLYLANGTITVVATHDFVTPDGVQIPQGAEWNVTVTNGSFSVALPPNIGSTPSGTSYSAYFNVTPGGQYTRTWIVPQSATPVNLADVQTSTTPTPAMMLPLAQVVPLAGCVLGVPQITSSGQGWQCSTPLVNPMTTAGDLIVGAAAGAAARLAAGTSGDVLTSNGPGAAPSWQAAGAAGVSSFNTRTGAVTLTAADVEALGTLTNDLASLSQLPSGCSGCVLLGQGASTPPAYVADPEVQGLNANGSAPTGSPVLIGGWDGTDVRTMSEDSSGRPNVNVNGTVPVNGTVTANLGTLNGAALDATVQAIIQSQGSTTAGEKGPLEQGAVTSAAPSYTSGLTEPLSLTTAGALRVDPSGVTSPVSIASLPALAAGGNTIGAVDQAGSWNVGITGTLPSGTNDIGKVDVNTMPAVTQSTGSNLHVDVDNLPGTQTVSGTVTANQGGAPWTVTPQPSSASSAAPTNFTPAYITSAVTIDSSPGNLYTFQVWDSGTAACYLEFFNAASGSVTLGTTAPIWVVGLFPTSTNQFEANSPAGFVLNFGTALSVAAVTSEGGSTTCPASTAFLNAGYK